MLTPCAHRQAHVHEPTPHPTHMHMHTHLSPQLLRVGEGLSEAEAGAVVDLAAGIVDGAGGAADVAGEPRGWEPPAVVETAAS